MGECLKADTDSSGPADRGLYHTEQTQRSTVFLSATPNLLLILTFSFGFMEGQRSGMLYGLLAGILLDLFYSGPFGFYTLFYIYVGYVNGICTKYYYEDYITLPLILSILNELAYNMYIYVFRFLIREGWICFTISGN